MPSPTAYIDTSLLIRMRFEDAGRREAKRIEKYDRLFAGDLLIAETFAFAKREKLALESVLEATKGISWIIPDRSLAGEIKAIAELGYVRGADLWHLACACYLAPNPKDITFLTRDARQREVAGRLGFETPLFS